MGRRCGSEALRPARIEEGVDGALHVVAGAHAICLRGAHGVAIEDPT